MKNYFLTFITLMLLLSPCGYSQDIKITAGQKAELLKLKIEISEYLRQNLLPWWSTKMVDSLNGGFYGRIDGKEQVYPDAEKGGILNARLLWTFSSAYRIFKDSSFLKLATRARDYILNNFIDREYGGGYRTVKFNGEPSDTRKHILTESYFIYALAEYYRATGDKESLDEAVKIFDCIEKYALDKESNGYFEVYTRDWKRSHDRLLNEKSAADEKTMITHLHLLEAYAGLYRVWPEKRMEERLRNILEVLNNKIVDKKTFHTIYFLDRDWNPTSTIDSYGHDIEASWLMVEAASLLKDPELINKVNKLSIKVANAAAEGLQADGSLLTEKQRTTGHLVTIRSWWEQAETIIGYLNAFELTGEGAYLDRSVNCWNYIKNHFIDYTNGGWYSLVLENGQPAGTDKAGYWTCPYHNGRMCMEVIERIKE
jgi:cellobiose epimerase